MIKILLCTTPFKRNPAWYPPLGLLYIYSVLTNHNYSVDILDIDGQRLSKKEVEDFFANNHYDVVGISALATLYNYVHWLANVIKKTQLETKVVLGGSLASSMPEFVLENTAVDICAIGEGEYTMLELAERFKQKMSIEDVAGIAWRKNGEVFKTAPRQLIDDLDSLPPLDYEAIRLQDYIFPGALITSRGCTNRCSFCFESFGRRLFRSRSTENVAAEINRLKKRHNIRFFSFLDAHIMVNNQQLIQLSQRLQELGIRWDCNGRLDRADRATLEKMRQGGCKRIYYGVESFSQKILDEMNKRITIEKAAQGLEDTFNAGIEEVATSFIVGSFSETPETIAETIRTAKAYPTANACFYMTPFPGTQVYERALAEGKIADPKRYLEEYLGRGDEFESISNIFYTNLTKMTDAEFINGYRYLRKELKIEPTVEIKLKNYIKSQMFKLGLLKES